MKERLSSMDDDKRLLLINSALEEFAVRGYNRSSLNTILKKSNISKGYFYHYFKNKQDFFNSLSNYCIRIVVDKLNKEEILLERNYIKRFQQQAEYKIEVSNKYPNLFGFLGVYYKTIPHEEYEKQIELISGNFMYRFIHENIDYTLFKDDLPHDLIHRVIGKYNSQILHEIESNKGLDTFEQRIEYYKTQLEDIKQVLYKKG